MEMLRKILGTQSLGCSDSEALVVIKRTPKNTLIARCSGVGPEATTPVEVALWALNRNPEFWSKTELGRSIIDEIRRLDSRAHSA
jgi:hypothetical protein